MGRIGRECQKVHYLYELISWVINSDSSVGNPLGIFESGASATISNIIVHWVTAQRLFNWWNPFVSLRLKKVLYQRYSLIELVLLKVLNLLSPSDTCWLTIEGAENLIMFDLLPKLPSTTWPSGFVLTC